VSPGLLKRQSTNRAIAVHSVLLTDEPFSLRTSNNFGADERTRIALFATNLQLLQSETLSAVSVSPVDSRNIVYSLPVTSEAALVAIRAL
jgi:hypothetical protein